MSVMHDPFEPGLLARLPRPPRNVVVFRASRLGDFLCATPAWRALRCALPEAAITLVGLPALRALVARSPSLDRFEPFPGYPGLAEQFFRPGAALEFFRRLQGQAFDLAIQMHGSGVYANPVTLMLGARTTAGFVRPGDPAGRLDAALPMPEDLHQAARPLALAAFLGARPQGLAFDCPLWEEDHETAARLLAGAVPPLIGVHPGAREACKRWGPEGFAAVGHDLQRRHGGTVVILGDREGRPAAAAVAARLGGRCLDLAGRTALGPLGAVIARLALLITNDSGPAQIAYALRVPSVTLFGPTRPWEWGPLHGQGHAVVTASRPVERSSARPGRRGPLGLDGVEPETVLAAALEVMARDREPPLAGVAPWSCWDDRPAADRGGMRCEG